MRAETQSRLRVSRDLHRRPALRASHGEPRIIPPHHAAAHGRDVTKAEREKLQCSLSGAPSGAAHEEHRTVLVPGRSDLRNGAKRHELGAVDVSERTIELV